MIIKAKYNSSLALDCNLFNFTTLLSSMVLSILVSIFQLTIFIVSSGGLAIAVPGEVKGMYQASQKYGRLPWKELVEPAIKLARDGFKISAAVAQALNITPDIKEYIERDPGLRCAKYMLS